MNLQHLVYFRKLAEYEHYSQAADELFVRQSTISHAVKSLEDELGCKLLEHEGRNVRLTEEGRIFQQAVEEALGALERAKAELKGRQGHLSGLVKVGCIDTARSSFLPDAMLRFQKLHGPYVEFQVMQGSTRDLLAGLKDRRFDIAICSNVDDSSLESEHLYYEKLVAIMSKRHVLAGHDCVTLSDLMGRPLVTYRAGTHPGSAVDAWLESEAQAEGITVGEALERMDMIRNYEDEVMLGALVQKDALVGLSLLTSSLAPFPDIAKVPLRGNVAERGFDVAAHARKGDRLEPAARAFFEFLRDVPAPRTDSD
ncbi:LysR family transcriptional regulator [Slackia heliotrinireducens]|uniref:LysR family transcriptional regulator n=1 Tax=Slackia heliotrinireducens TaxID=84110 RepID=UPI0033156FCA